MEGELIMLTVYAADLSGLWIFLIILGFFGAVAIIAFIIHIFLRPKLKDENKKTEEENAKEELDRILQPVDDEQVSSEIQNFKQNDDEEEDE